MSWVIYNSDENLGSHFHGYYNTELQALASRDRAVERIYDNFLDEHEAEAMINREGLRKEIDEAVMVVPIEEYQRLSGDFE